MNPLSDKDRSRLLSLIQSPEWRLVQSVAENLMTRINSEPVSSETEWAYTKSMMLREGQVAGIFRLFQELNVIVQSNEQARVNNPGK